MKLVLRLLQPVAARISVIYILTRGSDISAACVMFSIVTTAQCFLRCNRVFCLLFL